MEKKKKLSFNVKFSILAVIFICIFCISITPKTLENDTYYTIKIGEHIQESGIDMKDPFSWHENLDYTYPHWLYDFLTYQIYSNFGFDGIYITTVILACVLGLSVYFVTSKLSKNTIIAFLVTIVTMYLMKGYIAARAQLVTFILFIFAIFFIEKFLEKKKIRYAIGLVIISTLIANLHCAVWPFLFVLFLPYIGEYVVTALADFIIYKKLKTFMLNRKLKKVKDPSKKMLLEEKQASLKDKIERIKIKRTKNLNDPYKIKMENNKNVKYLVIVMIICALTGLLTPIKDTPYTYLIKTMQGNTTQNINEHLPMTLIQQPEPFSLIIVYLAILTFTKTKIRLKDLFTVGGLGFLMLASRRQLSMFALIGSVVLCKLLVGLIESYDKKILGELPKNILKPIPVLLIVLLLGAWSFENAKGKVSDHIVNEENYPVSACDFILENIDLSTARFYNEYNYGSYMLFRGIPVFIDSRCDLYAPEFSGLNYDIFSDFLNVSSTGTYYETMFEKYKITHVIMYKNAKIAMLIDKSKDPNYKLLYSDDRFVIYERNSTNE